MGRDDGLRDGTVVGNLVGGLLVGELDTVGESVGDTGDPIDSTFIACNTGRVFDIISVLMDSRSELMCSLNRIGYWSMMSCPMSVVSYTMVNEMVRRFLDVLSLP